MGAPRENVNAQANAAIRRGFGRVPEKKQEKEEVEKPVSDMAASELVAELSTTIDRMTELRDELELRVEDEEVEEDA